MSDRARRILEALERIDYFGTANPDLATVLPVTVELFTANRAAIAQLASAGITRESAISLGKNETRTKTAIYNKIYDDLRMISQTADMLESRIPNFINTFTLPQKTLGRTELLDKAKAVYADSAAFEDEFAAYGLAKKSRADLQANIDALEAVSQSQANAKRTRVGATAQTNAILKDAMANRKTLNRALRNHYRNNPQKLAEWKTAWHIESAPQKTDEDPEPPQPPSG